MSQSPFNFANQFYSARENAPESQTATSVIARLKNNSGMIVSPTSLPNGNNQSTNPSPVPVIDLIDDFDTAFGKISKIKRRMDDVVKFYDDTGIEVLLEEHEKEFVEDLWRLFKKRKTSQANMKQEINSLSDLKKEGENK